MINVKRTVKKINLNVGDELLLVQEPNNEYDSNAIMIRSNDNNYMIGDVPSYFATTLNEAFERELTQYDV